MHRREVETTLLMHIYASAIIVGGTLPRNNRSRARGLLRITADVASNESIEHARGQKEYAARRLSFLQGSHNGAVEPDEQDDR
jgi:hypothetical protein